MSRYTTVESIIWHDEKFRSLPEDARMLFLYLLTSPHSNMLGIFYLPKLYACSDLQWEPERYQRGIDTLCDTLLIEVDKDIVWIKNYLKHNPIKGPKQITGAVNKLMTLPDTTLIGPFMKNLEKHLLEDDLKLFKELYTKPYEYPSNTLSDTLCDTPSIADTDPDTDTVTDTGSEARAPADDDDVDATSQIVKYFAQAFGYPPNSMQLEVLRSFIADGMAEEVVIEALKRSGENGAQNPSYTKSILQSWLSKKAYTLDDVKTLDKFRSPPRSRGGPVTRDEFTYKQTRQDRSQFAFLREDGHEKGGRK